MLNSGTSQLVRFFVRKLSLETQRGGLETHTRWPATGPPPKQIRHELNEGGSEKQTVANTSLYTAPNSFKDCSQVMQTRTSLQVRLAVPEDVPELVAFNQAMALETEGKALEDGVINAGVLRVFEEPTHGFYVVAEGANSVVGTLMVTKEWSDWRNGVFWWIQSVYVLPEYRKCGIYRSMYCFVQKQADTNPEVCGFRLYVEKNNLVAQKTYQTLGMEETHYRMYEEELKRPSRGQSQWAGPHDPLERRA